MSYTINVSVVDREVQAAITKLLFRMSPVGTEAFLVGKMLPFLRARIGARFSAQGDDASGKWAPLANATAMIRTGLGYPPWRPINIRSGQLLGYVKSSHNVIAGGTQLNIPATIGSGVIASKIKVAQTGGHAPRPKGALFAGPSRPVPARPVLAVSALDALYGRTALERWIDAP